MRCLHVRENQGFIGDRRDRTEVGLRAAGRDTPGEFGLHQYAIAVSIQSREFLFKHINASN